MHAIAKQTKLHFLFLIGPAAAAKSFSAEFKKATETPKTVHIFFRIGPG